MIDPQRLVNAYKLLPHGTSLRVISEILHVDAQEFRCAVAPNKKNPLWERHDLVSSFSCVEYAAQAAAIHGIVLGAHYDPLRPAFVGAVKDVQLHRPHYESTLTVNILAEQEYCQNDGAIYRFTSTAEGITLLTGRLILKQHAQSQP